MEEIKTDEMELDTKDDFSDILNINDDDVHFDIPSN